MRDSWLSSEVCVSRHGFASDRVERVDSSVPSIVSLSFHGHTIHTSRVVRAGAKGIALPNILGVLDTCTVAVTDSETLRAIEGGNNAAAQPCTFTN
jgi:hypothetical protein